MRASWGYLDHHGGGGDPKQGKKKDDSRDAGEFRKKGNAAQAAVQRDLEAEKEKKSRQRP